MVQSVHRLQRSVRDIVDEAMDGGVIWNGLVLLHNVDVPLHTGLQVCTNGHEVKAMDVILGLLAQTLSHFLQAVSRLAFATYGRAAACKDSCTHYARSLHTDNTHYGLARLLEQCIGHSRTQCKSALHCMPM